MLTRKREAIAVDMLWAADRVSAVGIRATCGPFVHPFHAGRGVHPTRNSFLKKNGMG
jgi:hypothetical protein